MSENKEIVQEEVSQEVKVYSVEEQQKALDIVNNMNRTEQVAFNKSIVKVEKQKTKVLIDSVDKNCALHMKTMITTYDTLTSNECFKELIISDEVIDNVRVVNLVEDVLDKFRAIVDKIAKAYKSE